VFEFCLDFVFSLDSFKFRRLKCDSFARQNLDMYLSIKV
jgi:hypothetical protein